MSKVRTPNKVLGGQGFDKVYIKKADGTTKEVMDISRFASNSRARFRQDVVMVVDNNFNAQHILGTLLNGEYVIGTLKDASIVYKANVVVLEPFDKPVKIKVGTADEPTKYVAEFDCTQPKGTITEFPDCKSFIELDKNDEVVVTVEGADEGLAGQVAIILEVSKLGATTFYPSN